MVGYTGSPLEAAEDGVKIIGRVKVHILPD